VSRLRTLPRAGTQTAHCRRRSLVLRDLASLDARNCGQSGCSMQPKKGNMPIARWRPSRWPAPSLPPTDTRPSHRRKRKGAAAPRIVVDPEQGSRAVRSGAGPAPSLCHEIVQTVERAGPARFGRAEQAGLRGCTLVAQLSAPTWRQRRRGARLPERPHRPAARLAGRRPVWSRQAELSISSITPRKSATSASSWRRSRSGPGEPPRVCRRLHSLRRWSHDEEDLQSIFP